MFTLSQKTRPNPARHWNGGYHDSVGVANGSSQSIAQTDFSTTEIRHRTGRNCALKRDVASVHDVLLLPHSHCAIVSVGRVVWPFTELRESFLPSRKVARDYKGGSAPNKPHTQSFAE